MSTIVPIDYSAQAESRLAGQHADKTKFVAWVRALTEMFNDLEAAALVIAQLDEFEAKNPTGEYVVQGANLDVVGAVLGQCRRIPSAIPRVLFGWDDDDYAAGWGEEDDELAGGNWWSEGETLYDDALLDDAVYRQALRLRRLKLGTRFAHINDLYEALKIIFPDYFTGITMGPQPFEVVDPGHMVFSIGLGRRPTTMELVLLLLADALPRPSGVRLAGVYYWDPAQHVFGWDDDYFADGWGEDGDPEAGGIFAEEATI